MEVGKISIKDNIRTVLEALSKAKRNDMGDAWISGKELQKVSGLDPADINDAVEILEARGQVKTMKVMGTAPFKFLQVTITSHGRLELE